MLIRSVSYPGIEMVGQFCRVSVVIPLGKNISSIEMVYPFPGIEILYPFPNVEF
jgi:hypothetical protein